MADTRSFEERQRALIDAELDARLVGNEQFIRYYERALSRMHQLEAALNKIVDVLGCGGGDRFVPAFDPDQDNDREALEIAEKVLRGDVLVYHARTETSGCNCGWAILGASYAEHVADVYEKSYLVNKRELSEQNVQLQVE